MRGAFVTSSGMGWVPFATSVALHAGLLVVIAGAFGGRNLSGAIGGSAIMIEFTAGQTAAATKPEVDEQPVVTMRAPEFAEVSLSRRVIHRVQPKVEPVRVNNTEGNDSTTERAVAASTIGPNASRDGVGTLRVGSYLPKPPYPTSARRAGFEGTVVLDAVIDPEGDVARAEIISSSGRPDCDSAARETVERRWRFAEAGTISHQKIAISFRLQDLS